MVKSSKKKVNSVNGSHQLKLEGVTLGRGGGKASQVVNMQKLCGDEIWSVKVGLVNVGSMAKKSGEVVEWCIREE